MGISYIFYLKCLYELLGYIWILVKTYISVHNPNVTKCQQIVNKKRYK